MNNIQIKEYILRKCLRQGASIYIYNPSPLGLFLFPCLSCIRSQRASRVVQNLGKPHQRPNFVQVEVSTQRGLRISLMIAAGIY